MRKDKPQSSFVNIGSSSLLIIFLVLCLVTFAILSLSSAKSDYTFSERLAAHKTEYYEASAKAELIVSQIDEELEETARSSHEDITSYMNTITTTFDGTQIEDTTLTCQTTDHGIIISFQIPMSQKQALDVKLKAVDYTESDTYYEINAWQVISTDKWDGDQSIQLLPMGE